jgi:hypothetical protein
VKRTHKINHGWCPPKNDLRISDPLSERYEAELDSARRRAEKAWRKAQKDVERAERRAAQRPDPETIAAREEARRLVLQRLDELREIEELMRTPTHGATKAVHRTGREERLEVGVYAKPKKKRQRKAARITTRRKP